MTKPQPRPILNDDFVTRPFRIGFLRGVGYVVVEAETLVVRAEFDGNADGYQAAYELAAELNLEAAAQDADDAAALAEARDAAAEFRAAQPAPQPVSDPWDDGNEVYTDTSMSPERAAEFDSWLTSPPPPCQTWDARTAALAGVAAALQGEQPAPLAVGVPQELIATAHITVTDRLELRRGPLGHVAFVISEDRYGYSSEALQGFADAGQGRDWIEAEVLRRRPCGTCQQAPCTCPAPRLHVTATMLRDIWQDEGGAARVAAILTQLPTRERNRLTVDYWTLLRQGGQAVSLREIGVQFALVQAA